MTERFSQERRAVYRIMVQGRLDQKWSDYLGGLTIRSNDVSGQSVTTLSGQVLDQAALLGVLNSLYDLGFSLLSVEYQSQQFTLE